MGGNTLIQGNEAVVRLEDGRLLLMLRCVPVRGDWCSLRHMYLPACKAGKLSLLATISEPLPPVAVQRISSFPPSFPSTSPIASSSFQPLATLHRLGLATPTQEARWRT